MKTDGVVAPPGRFAAAVVAPRGRFAAGRGALVWRLYAIGIVQLALAVAGAAAIAMVTLGEPPWEQVQRVSEQLSALVDRPEPLAEALRELRGRGMQVSLYDAQRKLIASNVQPAIALPGPVREPGPGAPPRMPHRGPPPDGMSDLLPLWPRPHPPPPHRVRPDAPPGTRGEPPFEHHLVFNDRPHGRPPLAYARMALPGGDGVLVVRLPPLRRSFWPPLLALGVGLGLIFVGAFLTARWIGRPLEQLTRVARAFGSGDLRARTAIVRSDELGELARTFDDMAARMQRLLLAEKELLANVAHELRTPLARIRVALEIAVEGDAEAARASLAEIAVDLAELEALINDVLIATRFELVDGQVPESGFALHCQRTPVRALAERAVERFLSHHPRRALELDLQLARAGDGDGPPPEIEVDPMLFRRVLDNLLDNAQKYTPDASLPIVLRATQEGEQAVFEVRDRGIGIADADLPHVFGAFFRSERSRSRGTGGVGLGLTLVKRIVDAHGGTIRIASAQGAGTTVRVSVPIAR